MKPAPGTRRHMRAIAVVPSFKEAEIVGETVAALWGLELLDDITVVDDASGDGTAEAARDAGARVVVNGRNLGKGGSLNRVLRGLEFDVLLLIDGDLGRHAARARAILEPVLACDADLSIAAFPPPRNKGGFGLAQGLGSRGILWASGVTMRSPLSGQRAMTRDVFESVSPFERGFGVEVGMTIDALMSGFRVLEVETDMSHRETGRDLAGFVHRGRQFMDISSAILRRSRRPGARDNENRAVGR